jgi:hypothetical protein
MQISVLKEVAAGLKKQGKLGGVSKSSFMNQLAFHGDPKSHKARFVMGKLTQCGSWVSGRGGTGRAERFGLMPSAGGLL